MLKRARHGHDLRPQARPRVNSLLLLHSADLALARADAVGQRVPQPREHARHFRVRCRPLEDGICVIDAHLVIARVVARRVLVGAKHARDQDEVLLEPPTTTSTQASRRQQTVTKRAFTAEDNVPGYHAGVGTGVRGSTA